MIEGLPLGVAPLFILKQKKGCPVFTGTLHLTYSNSFFSVIMKHFSFLTGALLGALMFCACHDSREYSEADSFTYTFNVYGVTQGSIDEISTRAVDPIYSLLVMDVVDGKCVQQIAREQLPSSEALSEVQLPLTSGKHQVYFLCSVKPWSSVNAEQLQVHWTEQDGALGDVWSAKVEVEVVGRKADAQQVQLDRAVAYVRTTIDDALPAGLTQFRQVLNGGSWTFDLPTQSGGVAQQVVHDASVPTSVIGKQGVSIGMYTFVPDGATQALSYTLTAFGSDQEQMQTYTFEAVPLTVNQYTNYQGTYFDVKTHFGLTLQTDWASPTVINF